MANYIIQAMISIGLLIIGMLYILGFYVVYNDPRIIYLLEASLLPLAVAFITGALDLVLEAQIMQYRERPFFEHCE